MLNVFLGRSDEWSGYQHPFLLSTCSCKSIFIYVLNFVRFVEVSHNCSFKFKSQVIPFGDRLPFVSSILDRIHSSLETTPLKVEYVADATGTSLVDLNKEETTDVTNVRVASQSTTQQALVFLGSLPLRHWAAVALSLFRLGGDWSSWWAMLNDPNPPWGFPVPNFAGASLPVGVLVEGNKWLLLKNSNPEDKRETRVTSEVSWIRVPNL